MYTENDNENENIQVTDHVNLKSPTGIERKWISFQVHLLIKFSSKIHAIPWEADGLV